MSLNDVMVAVVDEAVESGPFEIRDLVSLVIQRAPEEYQAHADRLARNGLVKGFRDLLRARTEEMTKQPALPGFNFPSVIAVGREDGEFTYVPAALASYDDALAGLATKEANIVAAQRVRDEYAESLDRLRAWMCLPTAPDGGAPAATVGEAIRRMAQMSLKQAADAGKASAAGGR